MSSLKYEIEIKTAEFKYSGTNATIYLLLHGSKAVSAPIEVNNGLKLNLVKGKSFHIKTKQPDLGNIWLAEIKKEDKFISPNWCLDFIVVKGNGKEWKFPNFGWVVEGTHLIREGTAYLPANDEHKDVRSKSLLDHGAQYMWAPAYKALVCNNILGKPKDLPLNEQWNADRTKQLKEDAKAALVSAGLSLIKNLTDKWNSFDDLQKIYHLHLYKPKVASSWKSDVTFGNERLWGATLTSFHRIEEIPKNFGVTDETVKGLLRSGETLESELKNQRLYLVDYSVFDNIPALLPGRYMCAPMCLFYLNGKNDFVPIAIQLYQEANPTWNPVYTPNDPENDWLMAKFCLGNADFGYFEAITHYVRAHLVCEPVIVAANQKLSVVHPVYKILKPHMKYHLGVNVIGRTNLFCPGGMVIKIGPVDYDTSVHMMGKFYNTFKYEDLAVTDWLKQRKIPGPDVLPNYFYRDDSIALWNAIETFVKDVLSQYYKKDEDVANDPEVQAWAQEVDAGGYNGSGKFPTKIGSLDHLVKLITIFISNGVMHHSVVNFAQYESFAFVPMAPACLMEAPPGWDKSTPVEKGKLTEKDLMKMLPSKGITVRQVAQMYVLAQFAPIVEFFGDYYEFYFTEKAALEAKTRFQKKLKEIAVKIEKRSPKWDHMHPFTRLTQSCAN